jgi:myo-inositol-1-phosphate synthase
VELKLEVWDSPNSAGVVIDAVRLVKLAMDHGLSGSLEGPSAYLMKSPPVQHHDDQAREMTEEFIRQQSGQETVVKEASEPEVTAPGNISNGHKTEAQAD